MSLYAGKLTQSKSQVKEDDEHQLVMTHPQK